MYYCMSVSRPGGALFGHDPAAGGSGSVSVRNHKLRGVVNLYLLFFIKVGSLKVIVSASTANLDAV